MRTYFIYIFLIISISWSTAAEISPESVVVSFGKELSEWCKTGDISHRENIEALCNGVKKCRVEDKIHADYQLKEGLSNYETFVLDSYLNMFQTLMYDNIKYNMSEIIEKDTDIMPDGKLSFVVADIEISGPINNKVTDLFLIRDGKITGIYSYSSQLGFSHLNGSLIKALKMGKYRFWDDVEFGFSGFKNGYSIICNEAYKCGLIDTHGNLIIPCIWDYMMYNGGDFAIGISENWDIVRAYDLRYNGKMIPENKINDFVFDKRSQKFIDGYMRCQNKDGKYGFLSESDLEYNISFDYDYASDFKDGYALVIKDGTNHLDGIEYIIDKNLKTVVSSDDCYEIVDNVSDGLVPLYDSESEKYGFGDLKGNIVIPCKYELVHSFHEGLCVVSSYPRGGDLYSIEKRFGYIDKNGVEVIPEIFNFSDSQVIFYPETAMDFSNECAIVHIVEDGQNYTTLIGKNFKPLNGLDWGNQDIRRYSCGLAAFQDYNGKWGFYNLSGKKIVPAIYDAVEDFKDDICIVIRKDINDKFLYGCINTEGVEIIPLMYDEICDFDNGIAMATLNGKIGLIDRYGNNSFKEQ